ncbi:MAG: type II toxin-antitoxin system RelE/ParE family toxin [Beijerinckiaceae bacterium]
MLKTRVSKQASGFLTSIPAKHARQIVDRLEALAANSAQTPHEELRGHAPYRRMRAGEYRVIFEIEADTLLFHLIGRRKDDEIYRMLERRLRR